ncbi:8473_t:CDS:2 [Diversispora eburnea]|uniref:8473_t:CDS:1 n=1 Tax=Diversispora eburnea TaxID=1213867 RepID=A0A9N9ACH5_9GLOM|nr:8473_t:CDS:2 [Diversispora eburnea]
MSEGASTVIPVENWPIDSTIQKLKEYLEEKTQIPVDFQKLIYKGTLKNDTTLRSNNFKSGIKVMLMGSSQQDIQKIKEFDSKIIHQPFESKSEYSINPYKNVKKTEDSSSSKYTFHNIKVIEHFPNSDKARELLMKLRDDRGIRGIMLKHQWSVGILQELSPAEHTILGYNQNAGQLISIRLRTDDMEGFRLYSTIRRTLLHELSHNVWGEHDENFHRLNRQLNEEVVSLDWTASGGNQLSKEKFYNPSEEIGINNNQSFEGGTFTLGGDPTRKRNMEMRELLAEAALIRLTKEEIELDEKCGSVKRNKSLE